MARVNRAVFSPFTQRLIRAATGLVLRKPITLTRRSLLDRNV